MIDWAYWGQIGFLSGYVIFAIAIYDNFEKCEQQLGGWLVGISITALNIRFLILTIFINGYQ